MQKHKLLTGSILLAALSSIPLISYSETWQPAPGHEKEWFYDVDNITRKGPYTFFWIMIDKPDIADKLYVVADCNHMMFHALHKDDPGKSDQEDEQTVQDLIREDVDYSQAEVFTKAEADTKPVLRKVCSLKEHKPSRVGETWISAAVTGTLYYDRDSIQTSGEKTFVWAQYLGSSQKKGDAIRETVAILNCKDKTGTLWVRNAGITKEELVKSLQTSKTIDKELKPIKDDDASSVTAILYPQICKQPLENEKPTEEKKKDEPPAIKNDGSRKEA